MPGSAREFVLTLAARDAKGIVYAVSGLLYQAGCNIIDSQQFGDLEGDDATGLFFMRVHFDAPAHLRGRGELQTLFEHARRVVVGITRVHDERQSDLLCRLDTRTEPGCTGRARALVVETVEPVAGDSIF